MPPAPPAEVETGAPAFAIMGPESMGLSAPPTDLHLLPDGRILAVSPREIAFGDGLRWEVIRGIEGQGLIAAQVAVDSAGAIYTGFQGGMAKIDLGDDARWHLVPTVELPSGVGLEKTTMISIAMLADDWLWYSGSGRIVRWRPGQTARLVGNVDTSVERIFRLGPDLFVSDQSAGALFQLPAAGGEARRLSNSRALASETITCAVPFEPGTLLVGTSFEGLQLFDGRTRRPFGAARSLGPGHRITDLCATTGGFFAAAVDTIGMVFFDHSGHVVQVLDRSLDHRLARIRRLMYSPDGVLWALLNEGVARVQFPSPLSDFEPLVPSGLVYARPLRHAGQLWLLADGRATHGRYDDGRLERFEDDSPAGRFVFTLTEADGQLFAGNDAGIFVHEAGGWTLAVPGIQNPRVGVGRSTDDGIPYVGRGEFGFFRRTATGYTARRIASPGLGENYNAVQDAAGIVWLELGTSRVARFDPNPRQPRLDILGPRDGLSEGWVETYLIDGVARFHVASRVLRFDDATGKFVDDVELLARFPQFATAEGRPMVDGLGRIWYTASGAVHLVDPADGGSERILPLGFSPTEYTPEADGKVWMFEKQRLVRFDPRISPPPPHPLRALLTSVEFPASGRRRFAPGGRLAPVDFSDNSLVFRFAAPANPFISPIAFEVLLEGAGSRWVSTGTVGSATFNRLKEGDYLFRVRPIAGPNGPGAEAQVAFTVRPPWFRTPLAWGVYAFSAASLVGLAAWLASFLQRRENTRLERLVSARTRELHAMNGELGRQIAETSEKSAALSASEERYRTLNAELEKRVATRTAELSLSNRELQQREALFRLVFEHAPVGISWKRADLDGEIHFNPTYLRILGLPPGTPFDLNRLFQLVHPDDLPQQREQSRRIQSGESDAYTLEERLVLADGRLVWGSLSVAVIRNPAGGIVQHIGILEDVTQRKRAEDELAETYKNLVTTSRVAGMAEVATGILHNIGNVLTSLNISANLLADAVRQSKTDLLVKLASLVHEHAADLGHFLTDDPKGRLVPEVLGKLAENAVAQRTWFAGEIEAMQRSIDHIKQVVALQQNYATTAGVVETLEAASLFEDALRINASALTRSGITVVRDFPSVPRLTVEKGKVLQILINLIRNARCACDDAPLHGPEGKIVTLRLRPARAGRVHFIVSDNGIGIAPENLTRIFGHGFTTRATGHGFGLHASALAAGEMKGALTAASEGTGLGATFTFELPVNPPRAEHLFPDRASAAPFPPPAAASRNT